jgi:hypothetical protein
MILTSSKVGMYNTNRSSFKPLATTESLRLEKSKSPTKTKNENLVWYATYDFNNVSLAEALNELVSIAGLKLQFDQSGNPCVDYCEQSQLLCKMFKIDKASMVQIANSKLIKRSYKRSSVGPIVKISNEQLEDKILLESVNSCRAEYLNKVSQDSEGVPIYIQFSESFDIDLKNVQSPTERALMKQQFLLSLYQGLRETFSSRVVQLPS